MTNAIDIGHANLDIWNLDDADENETETGNQMMQMTPEIYAARRFRVDLEPFEKIRKVEERCNKLTAFQLAHPSRQPDAVS